MSAQKGRGGRPTAYTQKIADEILTRLSSGETLENICKDEHLPAAYTVRGWVLDLRPPEFYPRYARARQLFAEAHVEMTFEIADDGTNDWIESNNPKNPGWVANGENVQRSRLRVDTRKWYASKIVPLIYGDSLKTQNENKDEIRVRIVNDPDEA